MWYCALMRYYQPFPAAIPLYEAGYPRVTHPSATNSEKQALHRPFDLHVLSTPPAFILSQDQTLNKMVSKQLSLFKSFSLIVKSLTFKNSKKKNVAPQSFKASWTTCLVRLVLRVSLTLFNLQGARRFACGDVYFITRFPACQEKFFVFQKFFSFVPAASRQL